MSSLLPEPGDSSRTARWLGLALLFAVVAGGLVPYLRRTGLVDRDRYEAFWKVHTGPHGEERTPFGIGRRCLGHVLPSNPSKTVQKESQPASVYVWAVRAWEVPGKLGKDALFAALITLSALWALRGKAPVPPLAQTWPALALGLVVALQAARGFATGDPVETAVGLRPFAFVGVALLAGWVGREQLQRLLPWLLGLLVLQLALMPLELLRGIPLHGHGSILGHVFPKRPTGLMVMPNGLGVTAACVAALALGLGHSRRLRWGTWGVALAVAVVSASGAGIVLILGVAVVTLLSERRTLVAGLAGVAALLLVAPFVPGALDRPEMVESAVGRVTGVAARLAVPLPQVVFGRGLGLGTNARTQLLVGIGEEPRTLPEEPEGGDSLVTALLLQLGLPGLLCFAAALVVAGWRNPAARPFLLAVGAASFVSNVNEVFPANLLLGLVLAARPEPASSEMAGRTDGA